jgi:hypothetical protein
VSTNGAVPGWFSNPEAIGTPAFDAGYATSRISSILNGRTKQFGWLQASATKVSSLSITSVNPATIRICDSRR